jgi:hypothetical protein
MPTFATPISIVGNNNWILRASGFITIPCGIVERGSILPSPGVTRSVETNPTMRISSSNAKIPYGISFHHIVNTDWHPSSVVTLSHVVVVSLHGISAADHTEFIRLKRLDEDVWNKGHGHQS